MNKLFVYGIFLSEHARDSYGMSNPQYATVRGYKTVAASYTGYIAKAVKTGNNEDLLTGLIVDVAETGGYIDMPIDNWERLDALEAAYNRVEVETTDGDNCWMYVSK